MKKQKKKTDATAGTGQELILYGAQLESDTGTQQAAEEYQRELSSSASQPVTVDLSDVRSLSASGISILLGLYKSCKSDNRTLTLTGVSDHLYGFIETFALTNSFSIRKVST
jgi:anti-anti-sigma factor